MGGNSQLIPCKNIKLNRQLMWYICFRSLDTAGPPISYIVSVQVSTKVSGECSHSALDVIQRRRLQRGRQPLYTRSQETKDTEGMRHMQEKEKYVSTELSQLNLFFFSYIVASSSMSVHFINYMPKLHSLS